MLQQDSFHSGHQRKEEAQHKAVELRQNTSVHPVGLCLSTLQNRVASFQASDVAPQPIFECGK